MKCALDEWQSTYVVVFLNLYVMEENAYRDESVRSCYLYSVSAINILNYADR